MAGQRDRLAVPCCQVSATRSLVRLRPHLRGNPCFEKQYDDAEIDAYGGLTFSDFCVHNDKEHGICHVPAPNEPDRVWWLGFDYTHAFDLSSGLALSL